MTASVRADVGMVVPDADRWEAWVREHVDTGWRPGEWDQQTWFFNGDPAHRLTGADRCSVHACSVITDGQRMCSPCQKAFRASGLHREQFVAEHLPVLVRTSPGTEREPCLVTGPATGPATGPVTEPQTGQDAGQDDAQGAGQVVGCGRSVSCQGLCAAHYSAWGYQRRAHGCTLQQWLPTARPFPTVAARCLVARCGEQVVGRQPLCRYHYLAHRRAPGRLPAARWATGAAPFVRAGQFSLMELRPLVRWELLLALQARDARGGLISPKVVRMLTAEAAARPTLLGVPAADLRGLDRERCLDLGSLANEVERWLLVAHDRMTGVEGRAGLVWDLRRLNLHSNPDSTQVRRAPGTVDFTQIVQPWLREVTRQRCAGFDGSRPVRATTQAVVVASTAMAGLPGGGMQVTQLGPLHLDAVTAAFRGWMLPDGEPRRQKTRWSGLHTFFTVVDFGRRAGLLDGLPAVFSPDPVRHRIPPDVRDDDETGKAVPESVIAQLDAHLHLLRAPVIHRGWSEQAMRQMIRTVYVVLRDTGRRPREVCSLRTDCLVDAADGALLVWDNHKAGRAGRKLPIAADTAKEIADWAEVRAGLLSGDRRDRQLFPARTLGLPDLYLMPQNLYEALSKWVRAIPALLDDTVGPDGQRRLFDPARVFPYAFRHAYAQRHADAGVPIDVLRDLMDHKSVATTQGYYTVTARRKRDAVRAVRREVVDRHGVATPPPSTTAYELRSVAAPFGACTEPSNVKAGGGSCPIRFQCSGCGFYRADPSYLPAIDDHVLSLRADRETATAMGVDEFVIRNLNDQIGAYQHIAGQMRTGLDQADPDRRAEVEQASAVLRKVRAGDGRTHLPVLTSPATAQPRLPAAGSTPGAGGLVAS